MSRHVHIEIVINLNAKKGLCFCSSVKETETFGIAIFSVSEKNCIVKSQKCFVFPKSQYIILNPVLNTKESSLTKYFCIRSQITVFPFYEGVVHSKYNFSLLYELLGQYVFFLIKKFLFIAFRPFFFSSILCSPDL